VPVVDAAHAQPYADRDAYLAAIGQVRDAAAAYFAGLVCDDAAYDALIARVSATEGAHPQSRPADTPKAAGRGRCRRWRGRYAQRADAQHRQRLRRRRPPGVGDRPERVIGRPVSRYRVEPKIDGLAIAATYIDGRLVQVATRGDGRTGEDVTGQMRLVAGVPDQLAEPVTVEVRGEVFMTDADFATANDLRLAHDEPAFANPRTTAAARARATCTSGSPTSARRPARHSARPSPLRDSRPTSAIPTSATW
jgi:DNA ligase (NAD+)